MDEWSFGGLVFLFVAFVLLYFLPLAWAGYLLLARFDRGFEGAVYAVIFGPLGLALDWVMRDNAIRDRHEHQARHGEASHENAHGAVPSRDPAQPRRFR